MKTRFAVALHVALHVALCLTAATAAFAQTSYTSAASGSWGNASSWTPAGVPASGDSVTIQSGHSISLDAARTINNAIINGTLQPAGNTLGVTTAFTLAGAINGGGGVTVNGTGTWTAGTITNGTALTVPSGKTLTISGGSTKTLQEGGALHVGGTVNWTGGTIVLNGYNVAQLNIQAGGVFDAQGDNNFTNTYYSGAIVNNGTFKKSGGVGTTVVGSGVPFTNNARIEITSGTMTAAALTLNAGTVIAGTGFTVGSGTTSIAGAASVEAGSSMTLASGGTLNGYNNLTVNGTLNWTGGVMTSGASVTIPAAGALNISGTGTKTLQEGFTLNIAGIANWSGGTIHLNGYNTAVLNIQSGGVFNAQSDNSITNSYYSGTIVNNGTFRKSGGAGTTAIGSGVPFSNAGRIDVLSGTLTSATLTLNAATIISGTGFTVASGNTTVSGLSTVETGSSMTLAGGRITGASSLTVNGTLNWTGGSMDSGSGNVTIAPAGILNLSGAATKTLGEGFQLINNGTAHWTGGTLVINGYVAATLTNSATGLFSVECDASITNNYYSGSFVNHGTFRKSITGGTTTLTSGVPFSNFGRIEILTGIMTAPSVTMQAGSVIAGTGFKVAAGTLNIAGNSSLEAGASMALAGGQISGAGTFLIAGTLNWTGGSMTGASGDTSVSTSGIVNILSGSPTISEGYELTNHGVIHWTGGSLAINGYQIATFTNAVDGLFSIEGDTGVVNTYYAGKFVNSGIFRKSVTNGTTTWASAVDFFNYGRIEILTGTFTAPSVSMQTGSVIAGTGFRVASGTLNIAGDSSLEAGATMTLAGGQISGAGNFTIDGTLQWEGGSMTGNAGSVIVAPAAVVNITGGTPTVSEGYDLINNGTIHWTGGTIHLNGYVVGTLTNAAGALFSVECDSSITNSYYSGKFVNDGTFRKVSGAGVTSVTSGVPFFNNSLIDIQSGTMAAANLKLNAGSVIDGSGLQINSGSTTVAGPATLQSGASMLFSGGAIGGASTLTIDGTMTWTGGSFDGSGIAAVSASGVLILSGTGTKILVDGFDLNNAGTIQWTGGNIAINLNSVFTNQSSGQFLIQTDADITNTYYNGSFTNAGTMQKSASTGTTSIVAAVPFTNSGTIDVQTGALQVTNPSLAGTTILKFGIGGTDPLTGYGRLAVTGAVTLAGSIDVDVIPPFVPQGGDLFSVITYGSRTGTLAESLGFGAGRSFSTTYNGTNLTLKASGPIITPPLSPNSDAIIGGATVTINGTGFQGSGGPFGGTVTFGGTASAIVNLVNSGQLTAVAPPHAAGTVDVVVTNPDGQPTTAASAFTYTSNGDLSLTKTASTDRVATSGSFSYVIAVSNSGPSSATDVTVTDTLPTGMALVSASGTGWSCSDNGAAPPTITCTMLTLAAGAANPITVNVTAPATSNPALTNTASVTSTSSDPNLSNNSGSATVEVIDPPSSITVTSANDSGSGSLREALDDAINGLCTSPCTILFNLSSVQPIQPLTALPVLNTTVILDGTSQPGYAGTPVIEINGSLCACATGLDFGGSGSYVKGLSITAFSTTGLHLGGAGSHEVHDCFIGVTAAQTGSPNGDGITIDGANNVHVEHNTISFNNGDGIDVLAGTGHHFISNTMAANGESAIDLLSATEPTTNDAGDSDTGPNNLQNAPVLNSATLVGGNLRVAFDLDSSSVSSTVSVVIEVHGADGAPLGNGCFDGNALTDVLILPAGNAAEGDPVFATATSYATACGTPEAMSDGTSEASAPAIIAACSPPAVTIDAPVTSICTGGSTTLTANVSGGTAPYTYQWHDGNGPIAGATSSTLNVSYGGDYSVVVTDSIACPAASAPVTIAETTPPPATISAGGPTTFCDGGAVVLTASAGASYLWSTSETTQSITVTTSGNYSVTVTDANGCGSTSAPTSVTVKTTPVATITASGPTTFCSGGSVTLTAAAATSYLWSNGETTQSIAVTAAGNYSVTVSNGFCSATSAPETVTVDPAPNAVITAGGPTTFCSGGSVTLTADPASSYLWSNGETTQSIIVTTSSNYSVTVTDAGCSATSAPTSVTVNPSPAATITANGPTALCDGASVTLTAASAASYLWSNGQTTQSITVSTAGDYSVTLTNGSCSATSAPVTVTVEASPAVAIIGPEEACPDLPFVLDAGAGFTSYLWSNGETTQTITLTQSTATEYSVTVTNAGNCAATAALFVDIPSMPDATITAPDSVVAGSAGNSASVPAHSGANIRWTISNGTITAGQGTNAIAFTAGAAGDVVVSVTMSTNCTVTASKTISTTVACATAPPSLIAPADGASGLTAPVTFSWTSVGAASYEVWLVSDGSSLLLGTTAATQLSSAVPSGTFGWFVLAHFADGCDSVTSATRTFTVAPADNCSTHAASQIIAPAAGATVDSPVTFQWTAVADAIGYRLLIETGGPPLQEVGTTSGALALTASIPPGATVAYVDALFNACPATRSQPVAFTVPEVDPCTRRTSAAPLLPADDSIVQSSSIRFEWNPANDADGYRVWVSIDDGAAYVAGTTLETSLHTVIARGGVTWWIETLYDGCGSTESARFHFTIPAAQNCGTGRPEPLSPKDVTIADADPLFSWSGVEDAIGYEVWLSVSNGTPALAGTTGGNVTSLQLSIPPGELEWFVRALVDRCPARDSVSARFTYQVPNACSGDERAVGISPIEGAEVTSPVDFTWSAPGGAVRHELFVMRGNSAPQLVADTAAAHAEDIALPNGALRWFVRTHFADGCSPLDSAEQQLRVVPAPPACAPLAGPVISAPGQISGGVPFRIQWTPIAGATSYQLLISSDASFNAPNFVTTTATEYETVYPDAAQTLYYRVRAIDGRCQPLPLFGPYGPVSVVFILPTNSNESAAPLTDEGTTQQTIVLGPELAGQTFAAVANQPWLSVAPPSGVVPAEGITLIVTADLSSLAPGTSVGGVTVTLSTPSSGGVATEATTSLKTSTVKVTLVTPVTPSPTNTPPPDALIIPAVAHAGGINANFQSDVRVANTSPNLMTYQLTFRPTGPAGIAEGRQTTFSIESGVTVALDDVLRGWFGTGSNNVLGTLEVRPLTQSTTESYSGGFTGLPNFATFASSRTFNATANGTFGQSIPAIPFANFVGSALAGGTAPVLSLQQIANSDRYRSNLGIVEGSGQPVSLLVSVFGGDGAKLTSFPVNLNGGEHTQLNGFLANQGIRVDDGRVEVSVVSGEGKVTAYASVLDNRTGDPLLVSPVTLTEATHTKWVLPGVADLSSGFANWQTDMRLFNPGTTDVEATLSFHSQSGGAPKTATLTLPAGAVRQLDKALTTVFDTANDGGAIHITTAEPSRLIATARTYSQNSTGTFGQFISAVTTNEAAGVGTRPLQLLQIEESNRYRTNIGLAEVTGNPVKVEISIVPPDTKFTVVTEVTLAANEFRQIGSLLRAVGLPDTYNARVAVRAIEGAGRVTAYASVIDQVTQDPTYLAAQ
ncbi:MAG TPA: IPT/TIG domain-containing protein [Thermoanaerobaculia bacterium]|nr:IPT/TIG domain-containing protein [Thermoanaerobaculia bacterium]